VDAHPSVGGWTSASATRPRIHRDGKSYSYGTRDLAEDRRQPKTIALGWLAGGAGGGAFDWGSYASGRQGRVDRGPSELGLPRGCLYTCKKNNHLGAGPPVTVPSRRPVTNRRKGLRVVPISSLKTK